jgi:phosphoglucosamine mutase
MQASHTDLKTHRLFGTDGIRAKAGEFPLDGKTIGAIGESLARHVAADTGRTPRFLVGRDTRESGDWIEGAFCSGVHAGGGRCETAGVITTPGVAYITGKFGFDGGVVISASHNPFEDNGIKIFSPSGKKIAGELERRIEADIQRADSQNNAAAMDEIEVPENGLRYRSAYLDGLAEQFPGLDLSGVKIAIDCANGAASELAPELFRRFGAELTVIHAEPNGRNINQNCGSLHLEHLQKAVAETGVDAGVAFDGDADRALFVNEKGEVMDGDATLWILAKYMLEHGELRRRTVVATVMSNLGLERALESQGIELVRTAVGDKYVLDELLRTGSELGGEQSGHIIFPDRSLIGDGMATALSVFRVLDERGGSFSGLAAGFIRYPQTLVNVPVREKRPFDEVPEIAAAATGIENELNGTGRLLLRYSGTENLARVMIEGEDQAAIDEQANRLASVIGSALG